MDHGDDIGDGDGADGDGDDDDDDDDDGEEVAAPKLCGLGFIAFAFLMLWNGVVLWYVWVWAPKGSAMLFSQCFMKIERSKTYTTLKIGNIYEKTLVPESSLRQFQRVQGKARGRLRRPRDPIEQPGRLP